MKRKDEILQRLFDKKAVAVVRLDSDKNIYGMTDALIEGGITIIEVTLTTPNALEIITDLRRKYNTTIDVGVGSVLNEQMAADAVNAGAQFIVSPILREVFIKTAHANDIPAMTGAFTPTEVQTAYEMGADVIKVFPADVVGMNFFKGVLAPMPHLKLMPTGGVNLENPGEWIKAGACAVGVGSALIDKKAITEGNFEKIKTSAEKIVAAVKSV